MPKPAPFKSEALAPDAAGAAIPTHRCPLCGQANQCAMACGAENSNEPCWCTGLSFPRSLLERVPVAARGRACICQRCVENEEALSQHKTPR